MPWVLSREARGSRLARSCFHPASKTDRTGAIHHLHAPAPHPWTNEPHQQNTSRSTSLSPQHAVPHLTHLAHLVLLSEPASTAVTSPAQPPHARTLATHRLGIYGRRVCASDPLLLCRPSSLARRCAFLDLPNQSTPRIQRPSSLHSGHSSSQTLFSPDLSCLSATVHLLSLHHSTLQIPSVTRPRAPSSSIAPPPSFHPSPLTTALCLTISSRSTFLALLELYSFGLQARFTSFAGWSIALYHHTRPHVPVSLPSSPSAGSLCIHRPSPSTIALPLLASSFRT